MTDDEADELLRNYSWAKWSDARELLQEVYSIGWKNGYDKAKLENVNILQKSIQLSNGA